MEKNKKENRDTNQGKMEELKLRQHVAENLREQIEYNGLSIKELEYSTKIKYTTLSKYFRKKNPIMPSIFNIRKLCMSGKIDINQLLDLKSEYKDLSKTKKEIIAKLKDYPEDKAKLLLAMFNAIDSDKK